MKNKKGEDEIISVWWFFMLVIVGGGISVGVLIYHSADIDVREVEAENLYQSILNCITEQGFLIEEALREDFNIFESCKLNAEIFGEESFFYFRISFFDESGSKFREDISGGRNFEKDCGVQEEDEEGKKIKARYYPKCIIEKQTILYYEGNEIKEVTLEILTASNQAGKKISALG